MKKYLSKIPPFLLALAIIFAVSGFLVPQTTHAQRESPNPCSGLIPSDPQYIAAGCGGSETHPTVQGDVDDPGFWAGVVQDSVAWVVGMILKIVSLLTGLSAVVLNGVIYYTIVQVSENYTKITGINEAWKVIRDLANMTFIFVLLYAAIQTILGIGDDTKKLIVRVIIVAILINFSLFFTKLIIDVSNVLALLFYDAIAPGALNATGGFNLTQAGLSNAFMQHLSLTSLYKVGELGVTNIITIGVIGSIMLLIAAFVFFAVALMFIIRYVVLILVIILSPFAFMGWILPAFKKWWDQWWDALSGQAFFAPIYFMLTWIALHVLGSIMTSFGALPGDTNAALSGLAISGDQSNLNPGAFAMLINFIVVIVFLIASLLIAKTWANKAGPAVTGLTKWAMGAAGGATLGMAGRLGRGTIGRVGAAVGESEALKERAAKGGAGGMAARLALATGRKTAGASFDVRGGALGGTLEAGKAQKGGFTEFRKKQAEAEEKFAKSLAPSAKAIAKDKTLLGNKAEIEKGMGDIEKEKQKKLDEIKNSEELKAAETREKSAYDIVSKLEAEAGAAEGTVTADKVKELEVAKRKLEEIKKEASAAREKVKNETERITADYDARKEALKSKIVEPAGDIRKEKFAQTVENSPWAKLRGYNYDAAAQIRKGRSAKDFAVDALKKLQESGDIPAAETPETPPPIPPSVGGATSSP